MRITEEQLRDGNEIRQRIRQFMVLYEAWQEEGVSVIPHELRVFRMQEMAKEILEDIKSHIRRFNIHSGISGIMTTME